MNEIVHTQATNPNYRTKNNLFSSKYDLYKNEELNSLFK